MPVVSATPVIPGSDPGVLDDRPDHGLAGTAALDGRIHDEHTELQLIALGDVRVRLARDGQGDGTDDPALAFGHPDGGVRGPPGNVLDLPHVGVVGALKVARGEVGVPRDARDGVVICGDGGANEDLRLHLSMLRAGAAGAARKGCFRD